jgi:formate-dependent nitrite reductase membrane component NrfD
MTDRRSIEAKRPFADGRPGGTTDWRGSITERGTSMSSYYDRPIVKEPVWKPEIPFYFFTGGIAGASSALHGLARLSGNEPLAKSALYLGAAADAVSPVLLVSDLGRPERFLNMLRMFKVTSPMSVGSWILLVSGGASNSAAVLELLGVLKPVKWAAELVSFVTGPPLATYTGALLANTAIPVWSEARDELPWLFGASSVASAGAAAAMLTPAPSAGPARRTAIAGVALELGLMQAMERRLGFVGEVYRKGQAGRLNKLSKACTIAGSALLAARGRRSRTATVAGGGLVLAGELALRWSVFKAGFQSARDPRYTVIPQKERLAKQKGDSR